MDQELINLYKAKIKQQAAHQVPGVQRYKLDASVMQAEELLDTCYQVIVSRRRFEFKADSSYKKYLRQCSIWLTQLSTPGLLLYGNYGTGKTTMGKAITLLLSNLGQRIISITARDIATLAGMDPDSFKSLKSEPMLYIDEVGREPLSAKNYGNEKSPFIEILEYRYDKQLLTILTANLTDEEIIDRYGYYIDERIAENFDKVNYENKSYRTGR